LPLRDEKFKFDTFVHIHIQHLKYTAYSFLVVTCEKGDMRFRHLSSKNTFW